MAEGQTSQDENGVELSQATYEPTEYADASWEVVGEQKSEETFTPMAIQVLQQVHVLTDPMFRDYGGTSTDVETQRWHLPEHLAHEQVRAKRPEERDPTLAELRITQGEMDVLLAETEKRGLEQGLEQAALENKQHLQQLQEQLLTMLHDLTKQAQEEVVRIEKNSVELAVQIARRIVETAVEINPEYIAEIVREAIGQAGSAAVKKVRVSPQDLEFIEYAGLKERMRELAGSWQFEADASIKSGCVVHTVAGEIDYQLDRAWERVRDQIVKVMR